MASNSKLRILNFPRGSLLIKKTKRKLRSQEELLEIEIYMMISSKITMTRTLRIKFQRKTTLTRTPSTSSTMSSWPIKSVMTWRPEERREKRNARSFSRKCLMRRDANRTKYAFRGRSLPYSFTRKMSTLSEHNSKITLLTFSIMISPKRKRPNSTLYLMARLYLRWQTPH